MRLAIVHYHLRPGGVQRVIQQAAAALRNLRGRAVVLSGRPPPSGAFEGCPVRVVEGLDYAPAGGPARRAGPLADALVKAARDALGGAPDVWHIHNHALGKNPAVSDAVYRLARAGHRMVLQAHDFAEDSRPALYRRLLDTLGEGDPERLTARLYPQSERVHYAVLNRRDWRRLARAGLDPRRLHWLPNPVEAPGGREPAPAPAPGRVFLYPTRALRRKNMGEFLLWACLGRAGDRFAATLAPTDPADRRVYGRWRALARSLDLPVVFEVGRESPEAFAAWLSAAAAVVTTSVAEGFGLAFLEPWLAGRPLAGRDLPDITADFKKAGVRLDGLYERLPIPGSWIPAAAFRRRLAAGVRDWLGAYGRRAAGSDLERAWAAVWSGGRVDFGRLDEGSQSAVIRRLAASPAARAESALPALFEAGPAPKVLAANGRIIRRTFGAAAYRRRVMALYRRTAAGSGRRLDALSAAALLDGFLDPAGLHLLRLSPAGEEDAT